MEILTYTKKDIVRRVVNNQHSRVGETARLVEGVFEVLRDMLSEDQARLRIEIRNFGVFEVRPTAARLRARNPRTGVEVYVPPAKKTHFRPGLRIRNVLKGRAPAHKSPLVNHNQTELF